MFTHVHAQIMMCSGQAQHPRGLLTDQTFGTPSYSLEEKSPERSSHTPVLCVLLLGGYRGHSGAALLCDICLFNGEGDIPQDTLVG